MKYLIILSLLLTGCASTSINGVPPGDNQMLKVVGSIFILGALAKGLSNGNNNYCSLTIKNTSGQTVGTINTVKAGPC